MLQNTSFLPLVTIVVITYNSDNYVIETLESIFFQTYLNIELIISDDCSSDNTVTICRDWVKNKMNRFCSAKIITFEKNTGISSNCNRGVKASNGEWVKLIAGDDILKENCITEYIKATTQSDEKIFLCPVTVFGDNIAERQLPSKKMLLKGSCQKQLKSLLIHGQFLPGPSMFLHMKTLSKIDYFDEKYPFIDDYPLFIKYLLFDYRIGYVEESLVKWRRYFNSVTFSDKKFSDSISNYYSEVIYPLYKKNKMYLHVWDYVIKEKNKNCDSKMFRYLMLLINPALRGF